MASRNAEAKQLCGFDYQVQSQFGTNKKHHQRKENAQLLGFELGADHRAELRADDPADQEQYRQNHIHCVIGGGMQHGGKGRHENDLKQRCAHHDFCRHAQQVNHRRNHDETAADAHDGRQSTDGNAYNDGGDDGDIKTLHTEPHFKRKAVHQAPFFAWLGLGDIFRFAQRPQALGKHKTANDTQKQHITQLNQEIDLAQTF